MSDKTPSIEHEEQSGHGRFYIAQSGDQLAELSYDRSAPDLVVITHTRVSEQLRGRGIARHLLDAAVNWARSTHTRVIARCPYAKAQFERDASIRDVLA